MTPLDIMTASPPCCFADAIDDAAVSALEQRPMDQYGYGDGNGDGYGYGDGHGHGHGDGNGYGSGYDN